ncbi:MAG: Hint domain-containing protein [Pseudomonadota bacterium]
MHLGQHETFTKTITPAAIANVAGLCDGTTVMTLDGALPVSDLTAGDRIITRDTGMAVLRDVKTRSVTVAAVRIKAGSLGHSRPEQDMILGPDTLVHIRDWRAKALFGADVATVKAKRLLDGEFVSEEDATQVTVYELIFDKQHIVYADGMEVATAS